MSGAFKQKARSAALLNWFQWGMELKKLQIQCVVEDNKVGTDMLEEWTIAFKDYIEYMDVAAFNKN